MRKGIILTFLIFGLVFFLGYHNFLVSDSGNLLDGEKETLSEYSRQLSSSKKSSSSSIDTQGETWYDTGTELPHSVNYSGSALLEWVKKGDIIYEKKGGYGVTGHSAIVEDIYYSNVFDQYYIRLIEAVSQGVVRSILTPVRFNNKEDGIYRVSAATESEIDSALDFIRAQLGKPYWFIEADGDGGKNASTDDADWYCSELVWAGYYNQGINLDPDDFGYVMPIDINNSNYTSLIMHYQHETSAVSISDDYHLIICDGDETLETHEHSQIRPCTVKCHKCSEEWITDNHEHDIFIELDDFNHGAFCDCGDYIVESHSKYIIGDMEYCYDCTWQQRVFKDTILDTDYGYEEEYFFDTKNKIVTPTLGSNFMTTRLRCGYILNNYLTLSAKSAGAGTAYLEYHFDSNISTIKYNLALWSANESLVLNSSIRLEIRSELGTWITARIFNANDMSKDKDTLTEYTLKLNVPTKSFRFIIETNQVLNSNNRGRMVIGSVDVLRYIESSHEHTYEYNPIETNSPIYYHEVYCAICGDLEIEACIGHTMDPNDAGVCIKCGQTLDLFGGI